MKNLILILFLLFGLSFVTACQAQVPIAQPRHNELRAAIDRHDLSKAETILRELQGKSSQGFIKNNFDYLFARVLERRGNAKEAVPAYQKVVARNAIFAGYALGHLAELARAAGDFKGEQNYLNQMLAKFPAQQNAESARKRLGRELF